MEWKESENVENIAFAHFLSKMEVRSVWTDELDDQIDQIRSWMFNLADWKMLMYFDYFLLSLAMCVARPRKLGFIQLSKNIDLNNTVVAAAIVRWVFGIWRYGIGGVKHFGKFTWQKFWKIDDPTWDGTRDRRRGKLHVCQWLQFICSLI